MPPEFSSGDELDTTTIKIKNFEAYKGRADVVHNSWFRCSNRILEDHEFFDFSPEEFKAWIYFLCLASQKNSAVVHVSHQHAHHVCGLPFSVIFSAIKKLNKIGCLDIVRERTSRGRYAADTQTCATDRQTDITDKTLAIATQPPAVNPVTFYCDLWKSKNGKSPDIRPKEAGQLTKLVKDVGQKRALEIMTTYFKMPDAMFMKRGYDVGTMIMSLAAISQFEANGKIVTKEFVKQVEKVVDKVQNTKRRRSLDEMQAERSQMLAEANKPKEGA